METSEAEGVGVSMDKDTEEDVDREVEKLEEETVNEVAEKAAAHMRIGLTSNMSPVTLKI